MLIEEALVAIPCKLYPGAVSGERVFKVILANREPYISVAPRHFCWNARGKIVGEREPQAEADGKVAARLIEPLGDDQYAVEVPDGKVIAVDKEQVKPRPTPIKPPAGIRATT